MRQTNQGVIFGVKIFPKTQQNKILGWENGVLKIRIKAAPEKGEANRELIRFLSKEWNIPQRDILIIQGETNRQKILCICNQSLSEIQALTQQNS